MGSFHKTTTYKFPKRLVLDTGPTPNHLRCLPRQPQHSWFQVAPTLIQNEGLISAFQTLLQHLNDTLDEIGAISWHHATYPKYRNVLVCVAPVEMMKWWNFLIGDPTYRFLRVSGLWIYDDGIFSFYGEKSGQIYMYIHLYIYIYIKSLRWVYIYTSRIRLVMAFQGFFMLFQESFTYHLRGHKIMDVAVPSWSGA